jgi:hypothetical protein
MHPLLTKSRLALLALGAGGVLIFLGCLYTEKIDPIKKPPAVDIELVTNNETIFVGEEIYVSGQNSQDPDGSSLSYEWSLEYNVGTENAFMDCDPATDTGSCNGGRKSICCFIPLTRTTFTVRLRVSDSDGFQSRPDAGELIIPINNRPPTATVTVETERNSLGYFTSGQDIWLHGFESTDPDEGDALSYVWEVDRPSGSVTEAFVLQPSDTARNPTADPQQAKRCLMIPDHPGMYVVHLTVSDGEESDTISETVIVDVDAPPCIEETHPPHSVVNPWLVFDLEQTRRLEVLKVSDDLDPYPPEGRLSFIWKTEDQAGQGFRTIPGYHEPYFDVIPDDYVAGQVVRIRVLVSDRIARDPYTQCNETQDTCFAEDTCAQWVTWNIEYR